VRPYGMTRIEYYNSDDRVGASLYGRKTKFGRGRRKQTMRRIIKRRARAVNRAICREEE